MSLGITEEHTPDKKWLLDFISTHISDSDIFKKGYLPPPKESSIHVAPKLELPVDFLADLPPSKRKVKAKRL
jgi:hypothetical protein